MFVGEEKRVKRASKTRPGWQAIVLQAQASKGFEISQFRSGALMAELPVPESFWQDTQSHSTCRDEVTSILTN
jgi:hypothetical protein